MNREQSIAKNSFIFSAGRISAQLIGFLLLPLYSDLLLPEDYGTADLINTIVFLILPFIGIQMDTALFRFTVDCRNNSEKQEELFSTVLIVNAIQVLFYSVCFIAVRPLINLQYKDFILINVVLLVLVNTFLQFMRGLGMNLKYSAALFITSVSSLILNVVLVAVVRIGITGIIIGSAASQFLTLLFAFFAVRPWNYFRIKRFKGSTARDLLKYSLPLVPNQLAWWVMGISDRLVISGTVGVAANGIYSLANRFSSAYTSVSDSINLSWVESASVHINENDRNEYISRMLNSLFVLFASACYSIITIIPYAFLLINKNYSDSYMQIPILMLAVLSQATVGLYSSILIALKKTKSIAVSSIIAATVNLVIDIALVNKIGVFAGSVSTLTAFALLAVLRCITVNKAIGIRPDQKILLPIIIWGCAVTYCYYYDNPIVNAISLSLTIVIALIVNRKILSLIAAFIKNKAYSIKHENRRHMIYGNMELLKGCRKYCFTNDLVQNKRLEELLLFKDESWNYIKNLPQYQRLLSKGQHPDWEDNVCDVGKYSISGDIINVKAKACSNNWLCFYINESLPDEYELSYDICIHSEFTEVQTAFKYADLGNRYRFMIKDNNTCLFEAVYEGDFLDSFVEVPFSLELDKKHRICVRVKENIYELYIDGESILAIGETGEKSISGNKACIILWNKTDSTDIDCEISNISIRGC